MSAQTGLKRKAHFLGTKIKSLRKRNRLTLEDLSVRCVQIDAEAAPSVSYLSMIENGKRVPSERLLSIIADIFQKEVDWFFDESLEDPALDPAPAASPVAGLPLEPGAGPYVQDFDEALTTDTSTGQTLPIGWTFTENEVIFENTTTESFPRSGRPGVFNAGQEQDVDRSLAVGLRD